MYTDIVKNIDTFKVVYPNTIVPVPSEDDYANGYIRRYFVKKANDTNGHIFEISKETYLEYLQHPLWIVDNIKWRISGPIEPVYNSNGEMDDRGVRNSNKAAIQLSINKIKNLQLYLPNLLQFHK
ncbi:MAG: hypothetical protein RLZZ196_1224 [Bacteroidota bacterium]|jgi:hypothetical protein